MVDVIKRGEPAIMVGHWPGMYFNGQEVGFKILKEIVHRLGAAYDSLVWMKLSEIARYWAAKELTRVEVANGKIQLHAPFPCPAFTIEMPARVPQIGNIPLREVSRPLDLVSNTWTRANGRTTVCFDLAKGITEIS